MKLFFMKRDAVNFFKINMEKYYAYYFQNDDNKWMTEAYGDDPFTFFMEVPDFELSILSEEKSAGEIDYENCKVVYENLKMLSESQAADERLWAGLCNGTFYKYMRRRLNYTNAKLKDKEKDSSGIISRFFFSGSVRGGLYRNTLAKCWWVGHATFDKNNVLNHFELLDSLGANDLSTKVSDIFYSNTFASNPIIIKGICDALRYYSNRDIKLRLKEDIRPAIKYLNAVGGVTLLDVYSSDEIKGIVVARIAQLLKGTADDLQIENEDSESVDDVDGLDTSIFVDIADTKNEALSVVQDDDRDEKSNPDVESEEGEESILPHPEYVTWGCYFIIHFEKANKDIRYELPFENQKEQANLLIEKRMLGKQCGYRIYLAGDWIELVDFGWRE